MVFFRFFLHSRTVCECPGFPGLSLPAEHERNGLFFSQNLLKKTRADFFERFRFHSVVPASRHSSLLTPVLISQLSSVAS